MKTQWKTSVNMEPTNQKEELQYPKNLQGCNVNHKTNWMAFCLEGPNAHHVLLLFMPFGFTFKEGRSVVIFPMSRHDLLQQPGNSQNSYINLATSATGYWPLEGHSSPSMQKDKGVNSASMGCDNIMFLCVSHWIMFYLHFRCIKTGTVPPHDHKALYEVDGKPQQEQKNPAFSFLPATCFSSHHLVKATMVGWLSITRRKTKIWGPIYWTYQPHESLIP